MTTKSDTTVPADSKIPDVIVGKEGVLFLATSVHRILEHITGLIRIEKQSIDNFGINIRQREQYCRDRGILYRHVIYPDKTTVLKSYFPYKDTVPFSANYKPLYTNKVIDLADHIPDSAEYFLITDTHLSFLGEVETTLAIMKQMNDFDEIEARALLTGLKGKEYEYLGDLGSKLDPIQTERHFHTVGKYARRFNNQVGANDGFCIVSFNVEKLKNKEKKRLLIFGDSFAERSLPLISFFYSEVLFCRTRYFHEEIVEMHKPDAVITESAERYFSNVRLDKMAQRFNLIYGLRDFKYSTNADFYRAYNAVLSYKRPAYDTFIERLLS